MDERKRSAPGRLGNDSKRIKREDSDLSVKDEEGATDKQLRERNAALREALQEKNRRIDFLEQKCSDLFGDRHKTSMRLQTVLNSWSILLKTLHTLVPDSSKDIERDIKAQGDLDGQPLPVDIKCELDEWFLSGTEPTLDVKDEDAGSWKNENAFTKAWVESVLSKFSGKDEPDALKRAVDAMQRAESDLLACQDKLQVYKRQVRELKQDLNKKEAERHAACRRYDRSVHQQTAVKETASTSNGAAHQSTGNSHELHQTVDKLQTQLKEANEMLEKALAETRKAKTMEYEIRQSMESMEKLHEEKIEHMNEQLASTKEALQKLKYKSKDIEAHMHEKWEKKVSKSAADNHKLKAKLDEAMIKNADLRLRLTTFSAYKDQFSDYKVLNASLEQELAGTKQQLEHARSKHIKFEKFHEHAITSANESEINHLLTQLRDCQASLEALQNDIKHPELSKATEREAAARRELETLKIKLMETEKKCVALADESEAKQDIMATHEEEINTLVAEIEAVAKEAENVRTQLNKTMTKLSDRDASLAKVNAALFKAEQKNSSNFEELAGVRLQVASLVALQKTQKTLEAGLQETLKLKEEELESLREHVKNIEKLKTGVEKEKINYAREIKIVKQTYTLPRSSDAPSVDQKAPCEQCEVYKRQEEERNEKLRVARASGESGEMSEIERYELLEARKKLNCSVCQDAPKEVMISKCSHMFCKKCMDDNLKARNRKCPTCKKMFGQDDVKAVWWT
ncbi:unnamed protein product [Aphanomyces euteiches]|uniref:E3 ubiquitin protein ligase n=1 Tax=Aphanomyces euteiches TaxID=100861 RepID=A0A6G0WJJ0_9STRA|nr:hypothetical protein Ae201684_014531 [Aphanomyces euteiches]KAH9081027.1 hypothetical protein Ae201684P_012001 [Aphanomyces euteiches]KAH9142159.1 hypothetical protein AeRB84_013748 [Aphanomyces euteiches]